MADDLPAELAAFRARHDLSRDKLADMLGLPPPPKGRSTIERWEKRKMRIQHPGILRRALRDLAREMEAQ